MVKRLEALGCLQRINAVELKEEPPRSSLEPTGSESFSISNYEQAPNDIHGKTERCIKYLRDLKPLEWMQAVRRLENENRVKKKAIERSSADQPMNTRPGVRGRDFPMV